MSKHNAFETHSHTFEPVFDSDSEILILGTFPSVKSRENNFYYGHTRNRFWTVLANIFNEDVPITTNEKKSLLKRNRVALWDVIEKCDISGSSDSSIHNVVPADIPYIINNSNIKKVFVNGSMAKKLYDKYIFSKTGIEGRLLPSTSPANAAFSLERLIEKWAAIKEKD